MVRGSSYDESLLAMFACTIDAEKKCKQLTAALRFARSLVIIFCAQQRQLQQENVKTCIFLSVKHSDWRF